MARVPDLGSEARTFADSLSVLLGTTVCDFARVNAVLHPDRRTAVVGTQLDRTDLSTKPVKLRTRSRFSALWLDFSCRVYLDSEGFLAVGSSYCGLAVGRADDLHPVVHYDFERDKEHYAEAHIQVVADHEPFERFLQEIGRGGDKLEKLHLPVGGRRFRPALEDLIEFVVVERLVDAKPNWQKIVDDSRTVYAKRQTAAMVRADPGTAIDELRRLGYAVDEPEIPHQAQSAETSGGFLRIFRTGSEGSRGRTGRRPR